MITIGVRSDIPAREATMQMEPSCTLRSASGEVSAALGITELGDYQCNLVTVGCDVREVDSEEGEELGTLGAVNGSTLYFHAPASLREPIVPKAKRREGKGEDKEEEEEDEDSKFKGFSISNAVRKLTSAKSGSAKKLAELYFDMNCAEIFASSDWNKLPAKRAAYLIKRDTLGAEEKQILEAALSWGEVHAKTEGKELKTVVAPLLAHVRFAFLDIADVAKVSSLLSPQHALDLFQFVSSRRDDDDSKELKVPESLNVFNNRRRVPVIGGGPTARLTDVTATGCSSSYSGNGIERSLDDNSGTYWLSDNNQVTDQWVEYSFTKTRVIKKICLQGYSSGDIGPKNVEIKAGPSFKTKAKFTTTGQAKTLEEYKIKPVRCKKLRVHCVDRHGSSGGGYILISQIQFWGN